MAQPELLALKAKCFKATPDFLRMLLVSLTGNLSTAAPQSFPFGKHRGALSPGVQDARDALVPWSGAVIPMHWALLRAPLTQQ